MSKQHIKFDSFNDTFPYDGSLISLTGVEKITISNIKLNENKVLLHLIRDELPITIYQLSEDDQSINLDSPKRIDSIFFKADQIKEGDFASFDLELISRYQ